MPFDRRRTALLFALAPVLLPLSCYRAIAAYPDRVIKVIVPFAPGGGTDTIARAGEPGSPDRGSPLG